MSLTNKEILDLVQDSKKNVKSLTHITNKKTLSFEDNFKISLCKHFVKYMNERRITMTALSKELKLPKSRVSDIINYKIKNFSLDKLIVNVIKLAEVYPKTREYLSFLEQAFEMPPMPVSQTKQLTRQMKDIKINGSESTFLHAQ